LDAVERPNADCYAEAHHQGYPYVAPDLLSRVDAEEGDEHAGHDDQSRPEDQVELGGRAEILAPNDHPYKDCHEGKLAHEGVKDELRLPGFPVHLRRAHDSRIGVNGGSHCSAFSSSPPWMAKREYTELTR